MVVCQGMGAKWVGVFAFCLFGGPVSSIWGVDCDPELPRRLQQLMDEQKAIFGPNCFNATLFQHYKTMAQRYVGLQEFQYLISRDFQLLKRVHRARSGFNTRWVRPGDVIVFDDYSHAGYYLGHSNVFDIRRFESFYEYRVVPIDDTHGGLVLGPEGSPEAFFFHKQRFMPPFQTASVYRFKKVFRQPRPASGVHPGFVADIQLARKLVSILLEVMNQRHGGPEIAVSALWHTAQAARMRFLFHVHDVDFVRSRDVRALDRQFGSDDVEVMMSLVSLVEIFPGFLDDVSRFGAGFEKGRELSLVPSDDRGTHWIHDLAQTVWKVYGFAMVLEPSRGADLILMELDLRSRRRGESFFDLIEIAQAVYDRVR